MEGRSLMERSTEKEIEAEGRRVTVVMKVVGLFSGVECLKVVKFVERQRGVETVTMDVGKKDKEITVTGKVEACHLHRALEEKLGKKVVLFSLVTHVDEDQEDEGEKKTNVEGTNEQEEEDEEVAATKIKKRTSTSRSELVLPTLVLKTRFHCKGCMKKVRSKVMRLFTGVRAVTMDLEPGLVVIEGWVDVEEIVTYLQNLLRQPVQIIKGEKGSSAVRSSDGAPKANSEVGGGDGDDNGSNNAKKSRESTEEETRPTKEVKTSNKKKVGEEREEEESKTPEKQPPQPTAGEEEVLVSVVVKRKTAQVQGWQQRGGGGSGSGSGGVEKGRVEYDLRHHHHYHHHQAVEHGRPRNYHVEMTYAPQLFSDENPNACSIT